MPLYPAGQLIDKTITLTKPVKAWKVSDINAKGDKAIPVNILPKGNSFVMDSFLLPTPGYTNSYGITYAPRKYTYFTYFSPSNVYMCIRLDSGGISAAALQAQGAMTVQQILDKEKRDNENFIQRFFDDLNIPEGFKTVAKVLLILLVVYLLIRFILPMINKKGQKA